MEVATDATPVIDELSLELTQVGEGVGTAKRMLTVGSPAGCSLALGVVGEVLERVCARRWALNLFAASRRTEVATAIEALAESVEAIEEQLLAALRACADDDLETASARVDLAAGVAATAASQARILSAGPLGRQIRVLMLEGFLE